MVIVIAIIAIGVGIAFHRIGFGIAFHGIEIRYGFLSVLHSGVRCYHNKVIKCDLFCCFYSIMND